MKIYIFADIEGISGISGSSYTTPDEKKYHLGCKMLIHDINVCVRACFEAGADEVIVRDGHSTGNNISWEEILPGVKLVQGYVPRVRLPGLTGCDAAILLGYHAMAGTVGALLDHTFSKATVQNMWVNDMKAGEFAIDTLIAGEQGVPVIMTSGCNKLCKEANEFAPEVITCQVKESTSPQGCILLPRAETDKLLREKTLEAIAAFKAGKIKPRTLSPASLKIEYIERMEPNRTLIAPRTTEGKGNTVEEAYWNNYR